MIIATTRIAFGDFGDRGFCSGFKLITIRATKTLIKAAKKVSEVKPPIPANPKKGEEPKTMKVVLTGYSSTFDQTDDTPFVTASNTRVRDGIVAANFLAFGTKVKIPAVFGDKVFTVEDRMAKKHNDKMDVWFPERHLARNFGIKEADVIILE